MSTISLTIDGRKVEIERGQSVLAAARQIGLDIPTLCYLEKCGPLNSCQVCLVKVTAPGAPRLVPSCGTIATDGMQVESETTEVHDARRTALELLFSDHVGDCLSPCHRLCPLLLNIPVMIRQIEADDMGAATSTVYNTIPLPATLGRLCHHPCEQGCRRGNWDSPAAIRDMEQYVASQNRKSPAPCVPVLKPPTGKNIAVVGAGPTGLAAAYYLARHGHAVTVFDRHDEPGGTLRHVPAADFPPEELAADLASLARMGIAFKLGAELGVNLSIDDLVRDFHAVLLAVGEIEKDAGEKLGVTLAGNSIKADPNNCLTNRPSVFAAGSAVRALKQVVRAAGEARAASDCVHRFLSGQPVHRPEKPFSSIMGRIDPAELKVFMRTSSPLAAVSPCDRCRGLDKKEAGAASERCLHCDCRSSGNCSLQHYAETYGADASRFKSERREFVQQVQPGGVIFESGKCILCGICVKLTEIARESLGLTFIGRGFDVVVSAPFDHEVSEGLRKVAAECVEHCPTGAIVFDDSPKTGCKSHIAAPKS